MVPFGRKSPVKLKKLMIDAGVLRPIRNSLPVIRRKEEPDMLLWAVGLRPSRMCASHGGRRMMLIYKSKITQCVPGVHAKDSGGEHDGREQNDVRGY